MKIFREMNKVEQDITFKSLRVSWLITALTMLILDIFMAIAYFKNDGNDTSFYLIQIILGIQIASFGLSITILNKKNKK